MYFFVGKRFHLPPGPWRVIKTIIATFVALTLLTYLVDHFSITAIFVCVMAYALWAKATGRR